jgi:hypothetical protein
MNIPIISMKTIPPRTEDQHLGLGMRGTYRHSRRWVGNCMYLCTESRLGELEAREMVLLGKLG